MNWIPRLPQIRSGQLRKVRGLFQTKFGREPTEDEIREQLAVEPSEFKKIIGDSKIVSTTSLSEEVFGKKFGGSIEKIDTLANGKVDYGMREIMASDFKRIIMRGLSRRERMILTLYYFENLTMKDIGKTLSVSESLVSQIHQSLIERLRERLANHEFREIV